MIKSASSEILKDLFGVDGQSVAVVGAATGFGRAATMLLASLGAQVVAVADDAQKLNAVVSAAQEAGGNVCAIHTDVTSESAVASAFAKIRERNGRLDALINAHTFLGRATLPDASVSHWQQHFDQNALPVFLACREAIKLMLAAGKPGGSLM
ncbi:3-beta-hydroxycholanate 3-dehydrogenase (NADP(+)) [Paraburkholderia rhynchosiae]|uniref:3-beta-hydroxycholanate 3-dehydrogenase (NADP(+)) n=1 Tax=Paraburkholderia rhynchosiae TaxID=487049 RepID=A0A2N7W562_9BURK|nr:hypothetical protein C0Z16_30955 [Paraburkholderia rhynchosiae]CAB3735605.1 3-beta-hydroxycholanate 3-dehydrogenase (NADP(+)) [Paraburkholderia rhynchosiae]